MNQVYKAALATAFIVLAGAVCAGWSVAAGGTKYKVALSLSYTGNDWQNEAANLVKGEAASKPYSDMVDLREDIAGPDVTKQIQTLNNEIAAGFKAIIVYPISPTALNATIKKACDQGVIVYAYDSLVTAPCAYNVHIDQYEWGIYSANWLAKTLHGKGEIAVISGVPGTTVDSDRIKALNDVLKKYPNIHIAGSANGAWAQAQGKAAFTSIEASHPHLDGVYAEAGCYAITEYLLSQKKHVLPCAGEMSNGHHIYMLTKAQSGIDLPSSSAGSPVYSGELAFINAVKMLQGKKIAHDIILPLPHFDSDDLKALGAKVVGTNPAKGALVFTQAGIPPGMFGDFWSPLVEQGLQATLTGNSNKISDAKDCSQVPGCKMQDTLTSDPNHSGGN